MTPKVTPIEAKYHRDVDMLPNDPFGIVRLRKIFARKAKQRARRIFVKEKDRRASDLPVLRFCAFAKEPGRMMDADNDRSNGLIEMTARIDAQRGERWFCSASEAEAAGWRAARG